MFSFDVLFLSHGLRYNNGAPENKREGCAMLLCCFIRLTLTSLDKTGQLTATRELSSPSRSSRRLICFLKTRPLLSYRHFKHILPQANLRFMRRFFLANKTQTPPKKLYSFFSGVFKLHNLGKQKNKCTKNFK